MEEDAVNGNRLVSAGREAQNDNVSNVLSTAEGALIIAGAAVILGVALTAAMSCSGGGGKRRHRSCGTPSFMTARAIWT